MYVINMLTPPKVASVPDHADCVCDVFGTDVVWRTVLAAAEVATEFDEDRNITQWIQLGAA